MVYGLQQSGAVGNRFFAAYFHLDKATGTKLFTVFCRPTSVICHPPYRLPFVKPLLHLLPYAEDNGGQYIAAHMIKAVNQIKAKRFFGVEVTNAHGSGSNTYAGDQS